MATATLRRKQGKANLDANGLAVQDFEDEVSNAFFMPATMPLSAFREWTYSDRFPKSGLIAYLGKEIFVDMSPERLKSHGSVKTAVEGTVIPLVLKRKKGRVYFDRARVVNVKAGVSNEPDGVFASFKSIKNGRVCLVPTKDQDDYIEIEGSPDWILEVVSRSSVTKDKKTLRECYFRAKIEEYWLIDARGAEIEFQVLIRGKNDYVPTKSSGDWQVSKVFGKKFRLRRITDELGDIDYRLDMK